MLPAPPEAVPGLCVLLPASDATALKAAFGSLEKAASCTR